MASEDRDAAAAFGASSADLFEACLEAIAADKFLGFIDAFLNRHAAPDGHLQWAAAAAAASVVDVTTADQQAGVAFTLDHHRVFREYGTLYESRVRAVIKAKSNGALSEEEFVAFCAGAAKGEDGIGPVLPVDGDDAVSAAVVSATLLDLMAHVGDFAAFSAMMAERQSALGADDASDPSSDLHDDDDDPDDA